VVSCCWLNFRCDCILQSFPISECALVLSVIDRLVYDAEVMQAATEYADQNDEPMNVTMEKVERYAKEIIPSFNAKVYFQFGNWLCKKILQLLYRVRVGYAAEDKLVMCKWQYMEVWCKLYFQKVV